MRHIRTIWFNGTIGVVKAKDEITGEIKCYIGTGLGQSVEDDTRHIMQRGSKITKEMFQELIKHE